MNKRYLVRRKVIVEEYQCPFPLRRNSSIPEGRSEGWQASSQQEEVDSNAIRDSHQQSSHSNSAHNDRVTQSESSAQNQRSLGHPNSSVSPSPVSDESARGQEDSQGKKKREQRSNCKTLEEKRIQMSGSSKQPNPSFFVNGEPACPTCRKTFSTTGNRNRHMREISCQKKRR